MALLLKAEGGTIAVRPEESDKFTVEELQKHVGGYFTIFLKEHDGMMLGREFEYLEQIYQERVAVNISATAMYRFHTRTGATIWGDVLLVPNEEMD